MSLALTIALAVAILTPALVGLWRDARRGVLALAGTLLGDTLAAFWAAPWGEAMSRAVGGEAAVNQLFISLALLLVSSLLIGYGAGDLLPPAPAKQTMPRRLLGALLGLLNGVLLAGYALRYATISSPAFAEELIGVPLAEAVRDGLPLLFLGLAATLAAIILARRLVLLLRRPRAAPAVTPASAPTTALPPTPVTPANVAAKKEVQKK